MMTLAAPTNQGGGEVATLGVASKNVHDRRLDENNGQCDTSRAGLPALGAVCYQLQLGLCQRQLRPRLAASKESSSCADCDWPDLCNVLSPWHGPAYTRCKPAQTCRQRLLTGRDTGVLRAALT
jgi:hypothetical protein